MATWQPPIPAGALYSKAARALGPALPLLAYCYDKVGRDGSLRISLHEAASDMDEAYPTVKRWWAVLADGPFFKAIEKKGRNGMVLTFKDVWIDWRILKARTDETFGTETGSEMIPNTPIELVNGITFGTYSGSEMIPDDQCNKVLITTDQAVFAEPAFAAPPPPASKPKKTDRTPEQQAYLDRKKAIESAYVETLGYKPAAFAAEAKAAKWLAEQNYTADQVVGCLKHLQQDSFYQGKHIRLQTVANQIGAWLQARSRPVVTPGANIPVIHANDAPAPRRKTPEELDEIFFKANGYYPKRRLNA